LLGRLGLTYFDILFPTLSCACFRPLPARICKAVPLSWQYFFFSPDLPSVYTVHSTSAPCPNRERDLLFMTFVEPDLKSRPLPPPWSVPFFFPLRIPPFSGHSTQLRVRVRPFPTLLFFFLIPIVAALQSFLPLV